MTHPIYASVQFPEYEYQEYPKWVYPKDGRPYVIHGPDEEPELIPADPQEPPKRRGRPPKVRDDGDDCA